MTIKEFMEFSRFSDKSDTLKFRKLIAIVREELIQELINNLNVDLNNYTRDELIAVLEQSK